MQNVSAFTKIVVGLAAVALVTLAVMYFTSDSTTSPLVLEPEKPLVFTGDAAAAPGPVFYVDNSPLYVELDTYLNLLLKETDRAGDPDKSNTYTQTSLDEGQIYLRRNHAGPLDPSAVMDKYVAISGCFDADCDAKKKITDAGEYDMVFLISLEGFRYEGILTTRTHKDGILVTGILSKGPALPASTETTVLPPNITTDP